MGRSTGQQKSNSKPTHNALDSRDSAKTKLTDAGEEVQVGMFCTEHNHLCYKKWNGKDCGAYTPEHFTEHVERLVSLSTFLPRSLVLTQCRLERNLA